MVQGLAFTSGALRAMIVLGVNFLGWTLMNHPLPWVELLVHGNTTYGSRWILQVQPTKQNYGLFRAPARRRKIQMIVFLHGSRGLALTSGALRAMIVLGVNFLGWTLMNHPLPWVELWVHGNTTYGSRWILQVQPTKRGPADFFARQRAMRMHK